MAVAYCTNLKGTCAQSHNLDGFIILYFVVSFQVDVLSCSILRNCLQSDFYWPDCL